MTEAVASLVGVLIAGTLLGVEMWIVGTGVLAWVVARRPVPTRVVIVAALVLGASIVAYVAAVVLIGGLLDFFF
jgi:hypothetical protein